VQQSIAFVEWITPRADLFKDHVGQSSRYPKLELAVQLSAGTQKSQIAQSLNDNKILPYNRIVFLHNIPKDKRHNTKIDYKMLVRMV